MEVCGGDFSMRWRSGRRFREVLSQDVGIVCGQWQAVVGTRDESFEAQVLSLILANRLGVEGLKEL